VTKRKLINPPGSEATYEQWQFSQAVQVGYFYNGTTLEADRVIYDQKTKRLHAEGNVVLTENREQRSKPRRGRTRTRRMKPLNERDRILEGKEALFRRSE